MGCMKIRVIDEKPQYIGGEFCYINQPTIINDEYKNKIKTLVEDIAIEIFDGEKYISGKEYFANENINVNNDVDDNNTEVNTNENEDGNDEDNELEQLKAKAKELGIKYYWTKSKETLEEEIAKVEE